ncbi:hypothetical protein ACIA48_23935 [Mycobacterium sp. NPDC051804]|uniref:hypothetical protein n=1 Tax=Mycobacterium sp. NPDC051804 TaxID=3364295 RepID=UPI0037B85282
MSTKLLRIAGLLFAMIALAAGGLQLAAFVVSDYGLRHLILALFALSVGISVLLALWRARR